MGSILNFVFLFDEASQPSWYMNGPFSDYISINYNYTVGIEFDSNLNNIIVLETHEHFK